jgi:hypothetical protein
MLHLAAWEFLIFYREGDCSFNHTILHLHRHLLNSNPQDKIEKYVTYSWKDSKFKIHSKSIMSVNEYSFVTVWKIEAPLQAILEGK